MITSAAGPKLTVEELEVISKVLNEENIHVKLKHFGIDFNDENLTFQEVSNVLSSLDVAEHVIQNFTSGKEFDCYTSLQ